MPIPVYRPLATQRPTPTATPTPQQQPQFNYLDWLTQRNDASRMAGSGSTSASSAGTGASMPVAADVLSMGPTMPSAPWGGSTGADVLSLGQTMPQVGPTVGNAAALPGTAAETGILANASSMGAGPIAAIIAATALGGKAGYDMLKGKRPKGVTGAIGRGSLAIATGGLSEVANKLLNHRTTADRQKDAWNDLVKEGKASDFFISSPVNQDQGVDDAKIASGKLGGKDVWATSAFFKKFSQPDKRWDISGTEAQREQIAKEILDNNLLDTRNGLTRFTDENAAQAIYDRVMASNPSSAKSSSNSGAIAAANEDLSKGPNMIEQPKTKGAAPIMIPRTNTRSPGIGLDGKRISYGK